MEKRCFKINKLIKRIRDNLYDSVDWIIMVALVFLVVGFIGWRLDVLFNKNHYEDKPSNNTKVEQTINSGDSSGKQTEGTDKPAAATETPSVTTDNTTAGAAPQADANTGTQNANNTDTNAFKTSKDTSITIPQGSGSDQIAAILFDGGAIESKEIFLNKVKEKNLETKLKAGTFNIPSGSTVDDVINIVSK